MSNWIINQATIKADICNQSLTFKSNLVKVRIRREVTVCLQAKKVVCGACLHDGQFKFVVFDQHAREVAYACNAENGDITFPKLTFERPGVYAYTIQEASETCSCWILDRRLYRAIVTVHECKKGKLTTTVSYPDGLPVFVNQYCPRPCIYVKCCCEKMCGDLRCC